MANPIRNKGRSRKPLVLSHVEPGIASPRSPWEDLDIGSGSVSCSATVLSAAAAAAAGAASDAASGSRTSRSSCRGSRLATHSHKALRSHDGDAGERAGRNTGTGRSTRNDTPLSPPTQRCCCTLTKEMLLKAHRGRDPAEVQVLRVAKLGLTDPEDAPALFGAYARVRCLDAEGNHLSLGGVRGFPELHTLSLVANGLRCAEVPGGLGRWFASLRLLDLSSNALPAGQLALLGALSGLAELRLSANGLATLPRDLSVPGSFPQLRVLRLDRNRLRDPADLHTLSRLPLLQRLALDYNPRLRALPCLLRERPMDSVESMEYQSPQKKPSSRLTPRSQQTRRRHRQTSIRKTSTAESAVLEVSHAPFPRLEHLSLCGTALTRDADAAGALCWPRLRVFDLADTPLARSSACAPALGPVLARLFCLGVNVHRHPATSSGVPPALGPCFLRLCCEDVDVAEGGWRLPRRDSTEQQTPLHSPAPDGGERRADLHPKPAPSCLGAALPSFASRLDSPKWGGRSRSCSEHRKDSGRWTYGNSKSNSNSSNSGAQKGWSCSPNGRSQASEISSRGSICSDPGLRSVWRKAAQPSRRRARATARVSASEQRGQRPTAAALRALSSRKPQLPAAAQGLEFGEAEARR